jgi:hypothetical protein
MTTSSVALNGPEIPCLRCPLRLHCDRYVTSGFTIYAHPRTKVTSSIPHKLPSQTEQGFGQKPYHIPDISISFTSFISGSVGR